MLRSASHVRGYRILGTGDGEDLGKVGDFLFDDRTWIVRYAVADTGKWLPGRRVLLAPGALGTPDWESRTVPTELTRAKVEEGPSLAADEPVSRRKEIELHAHYGWGPYWVAGAEPTAAAASGLALESSPATAVQERGGDPNLRSASEVTGYRIAATDGEIGHVEDMILDTDPWVVRYLAIDTRNWLPGRKVLVSPDWATNIDWKDRTVAVDMTREQIRHQPEYDPAMPVDRDFEVKLYDFHGRPYYWS